MSDAAPVIVWFRSDLRVADHPALHAAVATGRPVLPIYVLDDAAGPWVYGGAARWWLHGSLAALAADLERRGAVLALRRGKAADLLPALAEETGAVAIFAGRATEPWARAQEAALGQALGDRLTLHRTVTLFDPETIRTGSGGIYGVYGPFAKAARARSDVGDLLPAPKRLRGATPPRSDRLDDWGLLPSKPDWAGGMRERWEPGEAAAHRRLDAFLRNAAHAYHTGRNLPGEDGTSRLSPHLRWGELSARQVWHAGRAIMPGDGIDTFLSEIVWREFSQYLLWHHPHLPEKPLRPAFADVPFRRDPAALAAWQRGRTGIPIVDAGMRQLWAWGWMHNRVRMITGSFLVKQLLIDWREGERWFWDTLVDADLGSNSASWQWVAGSGIESQPYFRIFNPVSQGETWDGAGSYVRRWVPELAKLPDKVLHAPWTAPATVLSEAGVTLGKTYPRPIVDLAQARIRALAAYRSAVRKDAA